MIIKCQLSVSSLLLNIPKAKKRPLPHFPACTQSNGLTNKKQSKDLCEGERIMKMKSIHQSLLRHKLVYNGGFSNFELLLLVQNSTCVAQILHGLSYEVRPTFITKFGTTELLILIFNISPLYTTLYTSRLAVPFGSDPILLGLS